MNAHALAVAVEQRGETPWIDALPCSLNTDMSDLRSIAPDREFFLKGCPPPLLARALAAQGGPAVEQAQGRIVELRSRSVKGRTPGIRRPCQADRACQAGSGASLAR